MINAKEAVCLSEKFKEDFTDEHLLETKKIFEETISKMAMDGRYNITIGCPSPLYGDIRAWLEGLGYGISCCAMLGSKTYLIGVSWGDKN